MVVKIRDYFSKQKEARQQNFGKPCVRQTNVERDD